MSNGCEELGPLTVGLKEKEARKLAVHAARSASNKGDERKGVIVSVLSAVGVDFLGSTLLQGSIYVEGCGLLEGAIEVDLPTAPVALVRLLKVGDESAGARCIGEVPEELDVSTLLSATVGYPPCLRDASGAEEVSETVHCPVVGLLSTRVR